MVCMRRSGFSCCRPTRHLWKFEFSARFAIRRISLVSRVCMSRSCICQPLVVLVVSTVVSCSPSITIRIHSLVIVYFFLMQTLLGLTLFRPWNSAVLSKHESVERIGPSRRRVSNTAETCPGVGGQWVQWMYTNKCYFGADLGIEIESRDSLGWHQGVWVLKTRQLRYIFQWQKMVYVEIYRCVRVPMRIES